MSYFDSHYISNSDLKQLKKYWDPTFAEPENLEEIFDLGTLIHQCLLEPSKPFKEGTKEEDIILAKAMARTFMNDKLCKQLMMIPDFTAEYEFYRHENSLVCPFNINARCKMDGQSKMADFVLEYKGLSVTSEKAFDEAIIRFDYDQGISWYLDVSGYKRCMIVGVSKKDPRKIFKRLVDRDHLYYQTGLEKVNKALRIYQNMIG